MRGVFTAAFITGIEECLGDRLANHLDLIAGTSTGGLIALGLSSGRSGRDMLDLYRNHGHEIFSGTLPGRKLFMPKYPRKRFDELLRKEFGELHMRELEVPTCVAAYEAVSGQPRVFKTEHADDLYWGHEQLVWKVAAATSAAPTYFAPVQFGDEDAHVDGGTWANNPSMIAITEAVSRFSRQLDAIRLLSVGTLSPRPTIKSFGVARRMGIPRWARPGLALLQGGPSLGSHFQAKLMLGEEHYLRCDDNAKNGSAVALDDVSACKPLAALGHRVALDMWPKVCALLELNKDQGE
jgi:uncharacterized protein